jgi:regulatory protein
MGQGGIITRIEVQKRHPNRRSIFIDGAFRFGLDEEIVFKHGLSVGKVLDEGQIEELLSGEEFNKAKTYALNLLSYRDRSCREVRDRLQAKGYGSDIIDRIVASLRKARLLDDEKYAAQWGRERLRSRPMGVRLLKGELQKKGIPPELVETILEDLYSQQDEGQVAASALQQRRGKYRGLDPTQARRKMADFLLRRGFAWDVVQEAVEAFITEMEQD